MDEKKSYGLSRREMEHEVGWALRRAPQNPEELPKFIADLMITLIEKNNMAITAALDKESDEPLGYL